MVQPDLRDETPYAPVAEPLSALTVISRTVLSVAAATVDLTSIPATYETLVLDVLARTDAAASYASLLLQLNNDSGANYDRQRFYGNNGSTAAGVSLAQTTMFVGEMTGTTGVATKAGFSNIRIPNYARTTLQKAVMVNTLLSADNTAGNQVAGMVGGFWRSTAAVNRITLSLSAGNLDVGTVVTLYGVKGA